MSIVPPVPDERSGLLAFLAGQRRALRMAAYGLTDDQAKVAPSASSLSVGGLIKHATRVETRWIDMVMGRHHPADMAEHEASFRLDADEALADVLARYDDVAEKTESTIAGIDDLGQPVPIPRDVPWFPKDVEAWSVRWVLLHLIEETARHAGHADIVRESLDGATAFALMAAVEDWSDMPWIKPWKPAVPPK